MYLAAALLSYGAELVEIDREDVRRQKFCFEDNAEYMWVLDGPIVVRVESPSIDEIQIKFTAERLVFPPSYPASIRKIKSAIYTHADEQ